MSDSAAAAPRGDTVLIAVDGSDQAGDAFNWYMTHLHKEGNTILLVHGMEVPSVPTRETWEQQQVEGNKTKQKLQEHYTQVFKDSGVSGKFFSDVEKPGDYICDVAKREKATFIVIGTRGMGKIRRTILGSVSDYVVHHAACPVVVCRKM